VERVKLEILGLSPSQSQTGSFALILAEELGNRRLPIIIGMFEAQAIAIEMERIKPNRPMTHDLFKSFAQSFDFTIDEVHISSLSEGIFYSKIICSDGIRQKNIDARPSDAVALALRFNAPIYTTLNVMEEAGISTQEADDESEIENSISEQFNKPAKVTTLKEIAFEELQRLLNEALQNEDYEKAAKIRDEIERRN
jgi:uncharacterized protein